MFAHYDVQRSGGRWCQGHVLVSRPAVAAAEGLPVSYIQGWEHAARELHMLAPNILPQFREQQREKTRRLREARGLTDEQTDDV